MTDTSPAGARLADRIGLLAPFRIRDFRLLWTGMFVSMTGDGFYYVATAWQVYALSNRPSSLALIGVAWTLPQVLLVMLSGSLADRWDRRVLMIAGDAIRGVAIGTVGYLSITGHLTIPIMVGLVVVFGVGQAVFQPAFQSIVPVLVPQELLVQANSVNQFVRPFAIMIVGPALGGVVVGLLGPGWAFVFDAGTFVFSAWMVAAIRARRHATEAHESVWADTKAGLVFVRSQRWLMVSFGAAVLSLFAVWGPWETLMPFIVRNDLHGSATALGLVYAAGGVGAIVVAFAFAQWGRLPRRAMTALYLTWAVAMFATAGFGIVTHLWEAMLFSVVAEGAISGLVVIWFTVLQRLVPPELLGRVSSLDWMITIAGVPLSFAVVGPLADAIGADATLIFAGLAGGAVTVAAMFLPGALKPERDGSL
jgi:predicted MFS family arabinose efflux permease